MDDPRRLACPLSYLPAHVRWMLADELDITTATGLGYQRFAAELPLRNSARYTTDQIELIKVRCQGSATFALLQDYERRGGTIEGVQYALEVIGHRAQAIIPEYFQREAVAQSRLHPDQTPVYNPIYPGQLYSGNQQTEPSGCDCPQCQQRYNSSGYALGGSGRPDQVQRQTSMPTGSIYSKRSGSGTRRRRETEPTASGLPMNGSGRNSRMTVGSEERRNVALPISANIPEEGFTGPGMFSNSGNDERGLNPYGVMAGEINPAHCECDTCRLVSDPEQTQRLTLSSDLKAPCRRSQGYSVPQKRGQCQGYSVPQNRGQGQSQEHTSRQNSVNISNEVSQLYLDSDDSSSVEDDMNSNETVLFSESDREQGSDGSTTHSDKAEAVSSNKRRLCSKSDIGPHRLGDMIDKCPVCRHFEGAIPKTGSRSRNNSAPQKTESSDTDLRKSWHGSPEHSGNEQIRKISSDSVLSISQDHNPNRSESTEENANKIEATIYSRISPCNSMDSRVPLNITNSSSSIQSNSVGETYRNNLESGNAGLVTDPQACSRNIMPSDSSNCSGPQNQTSPYRPPSNAPLTAPGNSQNRLSSNEHNSTDNNTQRDSAQFSRAHRGTSSGGSSQLNGDRGSRDSGTRSGDRAGQPGDNGEGSGFVFVTYSWNGNTDPEQFIQDVITLCRQLRLAGIRVKIDMDESSYATLRLNKLDWIDKNVREASHVIVCVSPTYAADIKEPDPRNQASPRSGQLNARYIYDKLRHEYYSNQSQNRRTIPVMFTNYGTVPGHIPSCMRSTLIYKYPNEVEQIKAAIIGHGRFQPS